MGSRVPSVRGAEREHSSGAQILPGAPEAASWMLVGHSPAGFLADSRHPPPPAPPDLSTDRFPRAGLRQTWGGPGPLQQVGEPRLRPHHPSVAKPRLDPQNRQNGGWSSAESSWHCQRFPAQAGFGEGVVLHHPSSPSGGGFVTDRGQSMEATVPLGPLTDAVAWSPAVLRSPAHPKSWGSERGFVQCKMAMTVRVFGW